MKILITGACGFIGTNLVKRLAPNHHVIGIDNLSRPGSEKNLEYLKKNYVFDFRQEDITNMHFSTLPRVDAILHMAGQVGVQASIDNPEFDLVQNIIGTVNILEYARKHDNKPSVVFASTNKVYGDIQVNKPVSEKTPIDFHTPYGVSKGSAEQYVLDYARIYGVLGIVFRQSCIYGEHQLGKEEQGWVAWFLIANRDGLPLTIYGDGTQVRDALYIEDLLNLYEKAIKNPKKYMGKAYNIGGGKDNTLSLNELIKKANITTDITHSDWRPSDQKYYVSDIRKAMKDFNWKPKVNVKSGLERLDKWLRSQ